MMIRILTMKRALRMLTRRDQRTESVRRAYRLVNAVTQQCLQASATASKKRMRTAEICNTYFRIARARAGAAP